MAILQSCCCWRTVRKGSFASAIYTLSYFSITVFIIAQFFHEERLYLASNETHIHTPSILEPDTISSTTITFSIVILSCSTCGIVTSLLLIYGLYRDNKFLLIPWILTVIAAILVDLTHSFFIFVVETLRFNPVTAILFTIDFFLISLNIYSLLCVVSQYQEYRAGRGTAEFDREIGIPSVQYTAATTGTSCISGTRRAVTYHETKPTPTQSPTVANTSLGTESFPSSRRPSRKHVQFPDNGSVGATDRRASTAEHDDLWTIDLKNDMLLVPD